MLSLFIDLFFTSSFDYSSLGVYSMVYMYIQSKDYISSVFW